MHQLSADQLIARGRTADVYAWDHRYVLKLFHDWFELENIEYEQRIVRAVVASGVQAPAVGELIRVDGRNGLLYERVSGQSMEALFLQKPWRLLTYARTLARLHAHMHERVFDTAIPAQRARLQNKINQAHALSGPLKTKLLQALDSLPDGDRVCHGDFHPANVLLSGEDATIIDWIDATRGNPLADVARTSVIALGVAESAQTAKPLLKIIVRIFHTAYLKQYFTLHRGGEDEYCRWLPIVAGARLSENIPELDQWLVGQAALTS
ncbi:MAG TPA: aminoglycoside phosphotransferase family protein [Anaerolineales bacterium]|nr:aminoglycoside phosphotransferase family protein [Anaerolineales bacterium]